MSRITHSQSFLLDFIAAITLLLLVVFSTLDAAEQEDSPATLSSSTPPPKFVALWGEHGSEPGQFAAPIGIAISASDVVFVTDARNHRLQSYSADGKFLAHAATGKFPGGIAIDREGLIYVASMMEHKISVFRESTTSASSTDVAQPTTALDLVREFGSHGDKDGQLDQPGGLAFAPDGTLYVCDQINHRVQQFKPDGTFIAKFGEYGAQPGQFGSPEPRANRVGGPCMLAFDRQGDLYTTEPTPGRIQKFSAAGQPLAQYGSNESRDGSFGGGRNLQGPIAILFDRHNRAWISSTNHRVQCFTSAGDYLAGLGTTGAPSDQAGQFRTPHGLAINSKNILYIVDTQNYRVQMFELSVMP